MITVLRSLQRCKGRIMLYSVEIFLGFHLLQIVSLIVRFQKLPSYIEVYPWWENIVRIIDSTPSLNDTLMIVRHEWWLEIGCMNYAFGLGISEWSFYFSPVKAMAVLILSLLIASIWAIASEDNSDDKKAKENWRTHATKLATSVFGTLAGLSSMTLY